jgi:hypothetical protein
MSVGLAGFVVSSFDQSDWLKLLGIVGAMVALYVVAKRLGGGDETIPHPNEILPVESQTTRTIEPPEGGYPEVEDLSKVDFEPEVKADLEKPQPRNIRIIDWNFEHFDISTGPPDPASFADDLWLELYDSSTRHAWKQIRFVASPAGLEKMLHNQKLSSMTIPQTIVVPRYDLKEIRAAILDDLGAIEATRGDVPSDTGDDAPPDQ